MSRYKIEWQDYKGEWQLYEKPVFFLRNAIKLAVKMCIAPYTVKKWRLLSIKTGNEFVLTNNKKLEHDNDAREKESKLKGEK